MWTVKKHESQYVDKTMNPSPTLLCKENNPSSRISGQNPCMKDMSEQQENVWMMKQLKSSNAILRHMKSLKMKNKVVLFLIQK